MAINNPILTASSKWCCVICLNAFSHRSGLRRHIKSVHADEIRPYECGVCHKMFKRKDHLTTHIKKIHPDFLEEYRNGHSHPSTAPAPAPPTPNAGGTRAVPDGVGDFGGSGGGFKEYPGNNVKNEQCW